MRVPAFLALLPLIPSALSSTVAKHRGLNPRQGTSTTAAATTCSAIPIAPSLVAAAVAGCQNITAPPYGEVRNDIVDGICKPFTLIFARGTTEDGNIGDIVGPPFVAALDTLFGAKNVAVQGVNNYPADPDGFCAGGSATGSQNMAQLIQQTMTQCPFTKLCISGYSQGAQVTHNAAKLISPAATNFVNSVVLFGDPDDGQPVGSIPFYKVSTDCHPGDNICAGGDMILEPHLSYCHDSYAEATFALARSFL